MPNSFIDNLEALNQSSVTNITSLLFYISDNNNNRLINAENLAHIFGIRGVTRLTYADSLATGTGINSLVLIPYDTASVDNFNMFNALSAGLATVPFDGWAYCRVGISLNAQTNYLYGSFYKNEALFRGCGYFSTFNGWQHHSIYETQVFSVSSGDRITFRLNGAGNATYSDSAGSIRNWMEVHPVAYKL